MGLTDMKQSNQSTNEGSTTYFVKVDSRATQKISPLGQVDAATPAAQNGDALSSAMWSTDGLVSGPRLFQRSSSTPPTHVEVSQGYQHQVRDGNNEKYNLSHFALSETVDENNQDEELERHDLVMPIGKNLQRSWSAPPVPENFDSFFKKQLPKDDLPAIIESNRRQWNEINCGSDKSLEKTSVATMSPPESLQGVGRSDVHPLTNVPKSESSFPHGRFHATEKPSRSNGSFMTLVDRVQEDFPRTPSPVFGYSASSHINEQMMAGAMKQLRMDDSARVVPVHADARSISRRDDRGFTPSGFNARASEYRPPHRVHNQPGFVSPYPVVAPPGFQVPTTRGIYGNPMLNAPRTPWATHEAHRSSDRYSYTPTDYDQVSHGPRGSIKEVFYSNKFSGGAYSLYDVPGRMFQAPIVPSPMPYAVPDHHLYNVPAPGPIHRSKSGPNRHNDFPVHSAHSYSATSLLEEFKAAGKSDKWDLRTIQGHLVQFARDQAGSRFIQQKLEKADEYVRQQAFNEIFPQGLLLMTDVFGNYVIQKFFDHGSLEQQRRLVGLMKKNMVALALQVYGCRVIQKALEVTQVDEQLLLIREMRGHVMKCVVDQNGNHVLQKCIEAASWKRKGSDSLRHVTGDDVQFIVDDFIGHAAVLSMHAYGCRVIQRVLEHCSPRQIRPIIDEVIFKCRDLVKDQFGNYVVQHVIFHGDVDQRNTVMEAILPDVAKWSLHKYASNVVEACLDGANEDEIHQIVGLIMDCDESGASCALLPMMKHMYGNYVVQKLLDRADRADRQRIVCVILHNADYLKRFTYGKHVLSRLERERNSNHFY